MTARRWLGHGDWASARHTGTAVSGTLLELAAGASGGLLRRGVAVIPARRPDEVQIDSSSADRWRRVVVRLAEPVPPQAWLRVWTRVETGAVEPADPDPATGVGQDAPPDTHPGVWRAAPVNALDVRVVCRDLGDLWIGLEFGGRAEATARVADVRVETGDDGPVTALPVVYRSTGLDPSSPDAVDSGDGILGRYLGLLAAQVQHTASILDALPVLFSPSVAPDRQDAPWLERLAAWVALDHDLLPSAGTDARREAIATAGDRHGRRGTSAGLVDQIQSTTGLEVTIHEPLLDAVVWKLDGDSDTSALGITTGLLEADPGPPSLDATALLDASMLIAEADAGLPVHASLAHRICVHVPSGTPEQVAAVDAVVQRERPAHVLARTCAVQPPSAAAIPTVVGESRLPGPRTRGLANDVAHHPDIAGPGTRVGAARLPGAHEQEDPRGEAQ